MPFLLVIGEGAPSGPARRRPIELICGVVPPAVRTTRVPEAKHTRAIEKPHDFERTGS
jgi:hypothetical protein